MRILHTSDWHLGQNFYSKSRAAEHEAFLNWLLETAQAHEVDAIIVAGDIFDTGSPPSYARELYNRFVVNLQQTGCHLVIVAGNHDSVATLNESRDILAFLNTTVVASAGHAPQILKNATARRARCCAQSRFYTRAISCKARRVCPAAKNSSICCRPSPAIITSSIRKPARCAAIRPFRSLPPDTSPPSEPVRVTRSRDLYRYAGRVSSAKLPPRRLHCPRAYSPGADHRRLRAYPLLRLAHFAQF